ncbi:DEAD/DEAH box helicase [cf. Phormidesmis sp. LEGE 11477]|uniref:DEAD/DEAH box helicase n=1 Tax=cf. Phormidesmis sp. LEGE 11477 TaxID=1828680 RepID=UPI00187E8547|nr:DEAD/DEAH box helicase [cf. Phormidesmis sp. LEGE 11477]MBE9060937.1 DEAD/DEAH box helicase [cf. Phormidesmis sp. LEGE 11477]
MSFESLGLRTEILRAIADQGYTEPTPIQTQSIPLIIAGHDVMASAQTGTGKTAGFTLPLLQRLCEGVPAQASSNVSPNQSKPGQLENGTSKPVLRKNKGSISRGDHRPIRALIVTPTRELAAQIGENVTAYSKYLPVRSTVVFGGVKINPQISKLRQGVDILIATPGRLLDHVGQQTVDLSRVEVLVLDEADRMLDMGFIHDIRKILALISEERQTLLFSATFSRPIKKLADSFLRSPKTIEVARQNAAADTVDQVVYPVDRVRKSELLSFIIGSRNWQQVLVFTRTKHGANRLTKHLQKDGLTAAAIHGNKSQGARTRALADFKSGDVRVLVATDIAARGLDIDLLPHVVNFELPNVAEDYVHRIGRTGRAGNEGQAVSLVCVDEKDLLRGIERLLKREIPREVISGYEPDPSIPPEPIPNGRNNQRGGNHGSSRGKGRSGRARGSRPKASRPSTSKPVLKGRRSSS